MLRDIAFCALLPFSLVGVTGLIKGLITSDDLKKIGNEIALEVKDYYEVRSAAYTKLVHGFIQVAGQCQSAFIAHYDPSIWMAFLSFLIGFFSAWVLFIVLLSMFAAKQANRPWVAKKMKGF
ncbi:hypothetical protein VKT23_012314 [Stygiomarasmius scandens]|uniref:Uncharacterized protein n=1 Tax=Marasmiellus scandens TaxID=2682957 RepID=A0ABR1J9Y6_9AGAR